MHNELKPTRFLKLIIFASSSIIFIIGLFSIIFIENSSLFESTCFVIPIFSLYVLFGTVNRKITYYINDLHFFFWSILSGVMWSSNQLFFGTPLVMMLIFAVILYKRKSNFIKIDDIKRVRAA